MSATEGHFCAHCGERLDDAKLAKKPDQRFCDRACAFAYRRAHPQLYRAQAEATAEANRARWAEWKRQAGPAPPHRAEANAKRAAKIAVSNREKPRRKAAP